MLCTPPERQIPLATYERFLGGRQGHLWSWLSGRAVGEVVCGPVRLFAAAGTSEPALTDQVWGPVRWCGIRGRCGKAKRSTPAPRRSGRLTVLAVAVEGVGDLRTDRS